MRSPPRPVALVAGRHTRARNPWTRSGPPSELRHTEAGIARAMLRVAVSGRREQEPSFYTVVVWRDQAEHVAESLANGSRVVVLGRLQQRNRTAEDSSARSVAEVLAEEPGQACAGPRRQRPSANSMTLCRRSFS